MKKYYTRWILVSFLFMIIGMCEGNEEAATQSNSASISEKTHRSKKVRTTRVGLSGKVTNRKYVSICKMSPETAKRELKKVLDLGFIVKK